MNKRYLLLRPLACINLPASKIFHKLLQQPEGGRKLLRAKTPAIGRDNSACQNLNNRPVFSPDK